MKEPKYLVFALFNFANNCNSSEGQHHTAIVNEVDHDNFFFNHPGWDLICGVPLRYLDAHEFCEWWLKIYSRKHFSEFYL